MSREMLARARNARLRLDHVTALRLMDAEPLQFPDDSFDKVVAMYVVSVAPHPARLVSEMRRVCRPGGEFFIANHFQHANPVVGGLERLFAPLSRLMGFHPDFSLEDFLHESGLDVVERIPVNVLGYWTLLRARNSKTAVGPGASRTAAA